MEAFIKMFKNFFMMLYIKTQSIYEKPLSAKEEAECIALMQTGDEKAREKLISRNLRLVAHIMKKYRISDNDYDDILSIGTIGLIKAVDSFKNGNGTRFSTYAARCIENEILMYFRSQKRNANLVSINDVLDTDKEGNELTLIDIISSEDMVTDEVDKKIKIQKLEKLIKNSLTPRERDILILRYGLNDKPPKSQQETADIMGISRSYVSRIEKKAIEKLRSSL